MAAWIYKWGIYKSPLGWGGRRRQRQMGAASLERRALGRRDDGQENKRLVTLNNTMLKKSAAVGLRHVHDGLSRIPSDVKLCY